MLEVSQARKGRSVSLLVRIVLTSYSTTLKTHTHSRLALLLWGCDTCLSMSSSCFLFKFRPLYISMKSIKAHPSLLGHVFRGYSEPGAICQTSWSLPCLFQDRQKETDWLYPLNPVPEPFLIFVESLGSFRFYLYLYLCKIYNWTFCRPNHQYHPQSSSISAYLPSKPFVNLESTKQEWRNST